MEETQVQCTLKGIMFILHGLLGLVTSQKEKIPTQGETEYVDVRKWQIMRRNKAYVPTGKNGDMPKAALSRRAHTHTHTQAQNMVGVCRG